MTYIPVAEPRRRHSRENGDLIADALKRFLAAASGREFTTAELAQHAETLGIRSPKPIAKVQMTVLALFDEGLVERRRNGEGPGYGGFVYRATEELRTALAGSRS